jgi:hypothetical protein
MIGEYRDVCSITLALDAEPLCDVIWRQQPNRRFCPILFRRAPNGRSLIKSFWTIILVLRRPGQTFRILLKEEMSRDVRKLVNSTLNAW